jgi:FkbM family methyltransferase
MMWQVMSRFQKEIEFQWIEGSKLVVKRGMTGATGNIYCGLHEFVEMGFLLHFLRRDDLFLDVGANIGSYTILATAVCGARAISFEPDPDSMAHLTQNVQRNGQAGRVELVQAALGASEGKVRFTSGYDTMNRVASEGQIGTQEVELLTLDAAIGTRSPTLLKLDVEGFEGEVVAGGRRTLEKDSLRAVITESAPEQVLSAFDSLGFERAFYDPFTRQLTLKPSPSSPPSSNFMFVRDLNAVETRLKSAAKRKVAGIEL